ncbi:MAG: FadR/GntR family transcriptional regulator [Pararhodobacter sp.]
MTLSPSLPSGTEAGPGMQLRGLLTQLRSEIDSGRVIDRGRLMPERELAETLRVSRRLLRQALAALEAEGIIWRRQGHGTFVSALHPPRTDHFTDVAAITSPAELTEVRLELEPILARFCALRATSAQLRRLQEAASHVAAADQTYAFASADAAFHRAVAQGANNALFLAMFESLISVLHQAGWRAVRQDGFDHSRQAEVSAQHAEILRAINSRDPAASEAAMRRHLTSVYDHLRGHRPVGDLLPR